MFVFRTNLCYAFMAQDLGEKMSLSMQLSILGDIQRLADKIDKVDQLISRWISNRVELSELDMMCYVLINLTNLFIIINTYTYIIIC